MIKKYTLFITESGDVKKEGEEMLQPLPLPRTEICLLSESLAFTNTTNTTCSTKFIIMMNTVHEIICF